MLNSKLMVYQTLIFIFIVNDVSGESNWNETLSKCVFLSQSNGFIKILSFLKYVHQPELLLLLSSSPLLHH